MATNTKIQDAIFLIFESLLNISCGHTWHRKPSSRGKYTVAPR